MCGQSDEGGGQGQLFHALEPVAKRHMEYPKLEGTYSDQRVLTTKNSNPVSGSVTEMLPKLQQLVHCLWVQFVIFFLDS